MRRIKTSLWIEWILASIVLVVLIWFMIPYFFAAQNINHQIYFPDLNFLIAVREFMECGPNGRFTQNDVSAKTDVLDCRNQEIISLCGIEYFTNITGLDCSRNKLMLLDVSKNSQLTMLNCSKNQLYHIDLPPNSSLLLLDLSENQFDAIPDLNKQTKLKGLDISFNNLNSSVCEEILSLEKRFAGPAYVHSGRLRAGLLYSPQNQNISLECNE